MTSAKFYWYIPHICAINTKVLRRWRSLEQLEAVLVSSQPPAHPSRWTNASPELSETMPSTEETPTIHALMKWSAAEGAHQSDSWTF